MKQITFSLIALGASVTFATSAFAGLVAVPVPVPAAGVGLPALAVAGGAYWLFRKLRKQV